MFWRTQTWKHIRIESSCTSNLREIHHAPLCCSLSRLERTGCEADVSSRHLAMCKTVHRIVEDIFADPNVVLGGIESERSAANMSS